MVKGKNGLGEKHIYRKHIYHPGGESYVKTKISRQDSYQI
jgi:hypothetical protein